jgi:hypothetical protein
MFRRLSRYWWVLLLLPIAAVAWLMVLDRTVTDRLDRAEAQLKAEAWEAALDELAPVSSAGFLSLSNQRRAATLLLRMGEDQQAYRLLAARPLRPNEPDDAVARDLAARCYAASVLRRQSEKLHDPAERLRLARSAREALPEAPRVLEWVVLEELLAMTRGMKTEEKAFERDYALLRRAAPRLADAVKEKVAEEYREQ